MTSQALVGGRLPDDGGRERYGFNQRLFNKLDVDWARSSAEIKAQLDAYFPGRDFVLGHQWKGYADLVHDTYWLASNRCFKRPAALTDIQVLEAEENPNAAKNPKTTERAEKEAKKRLANVLKKWTDADAEVPLAHAVQPRPDDVTQEYAESIRRGQKLFASQQASCTSCHTDYGRTPTYRYDVWGVPNRVRNLTDKDRLWAREPADFARQLKNGIHAANMPAAPVGLTDQDIADLVHFVRELPFPQRLPDDVRQQVNPK